MNWSVRPFSFFFGQLLPLLVRRTAACTFPSPLHHVPSRFYSAPNQPSTSVPLVFRPPLSFPRFSCTLSASPLSIQRSFSFAAGAGIRSFVRSFIRSGLSLSAYLILFPYPPVSPLRYRPSPPPPSWSTSGPSRSSSDSPFRVREKRTGSCPARTLIALLFRNVVPLTAYPTLSFLRPSSMFAGHTATLSLFPSPHMHALTHVTGYHGAYTFHMHLHACNPRVSRSRIAR